MREVAKAAVKAMLYGERYKGKNTVVEGGAVYLHGHKIVWYDENGALWISLCGWNTVTTRSRINDVLRGLGRDAGVSQRNYSLIVHRYGKESDEYDSRDNILIG